MSRLELFAYFISFLITSFLISRISLDYFSRETLTSFETIEPKDNIGISLCFRQGDAESESGFLPDFTQPVSTILEGAPSDSEFIDKVLSENHEVDYKLSSFLTNKQLCYRIALENRSSQISIVLGNNVEGVALRLHGASSYPFGNYPSTYFERFDDGDQSTGNYFIDVTRTQTKLMSDPLFGNCINYVGGITIDECLETCIAKYLVTQPYHFVSHANVTKILGEERNLAAEVLCFRECPYLSCTYDVNEMAWPAMERNSENNFIITVRERQFHLITYFPKMSLQIYLIYWSSVLSGIFGLHLLMLKKYMFMLQSILNFKNSRYSRLAINIVVYGICTAGYLYQVLEITLDYANHEISINTYLGPPIKQVSPSVSFCVDIKYNINPFLATPCTANYSIGEKVIDADCDEYLRNSKLSDIMAEGHPRGLWHSLGYIQLSPLYSDVIMYSHEDISMSFYRHGHPNRFNKYAVTEYFRDFERCYKVNIPNMQGTKIALFYWGDSPETKFYLHDSRDFPRKGNIPVAIEYETSYLARFTFLLKNKKLLPKPYRTDCRDYSISNFSSRLDCYEDCIVKVYVAKYDKHPLEIANYRYWHLKQGFHPVSDNMKYVCDQQCRQEECYLEEFDFMITRRVVADAVREFSLGLAEMELSIEYTPKISTNDFLICFVGTLGLWFGIAMLSPFEYAKRYIKNHKNKRHVFRAFQICLIGGLLYHCINTTIIYANSEVTTKTAVEMIENFKLPLMYFAYSVAFGSLGNFTRDQTSELYFNTSAHELDGVTNNMTSIIDSIAIRDPITLEWRDIAIYDYFYDFAYYYNYMKFLAIGVTDKKYSGYNSKRLRYSGDTSVIKFKTSDKLGFYYIALISDSFSNAEKSQVSIVKDDAFHVALTFTEADAYLLPPPYVSNCFDYSSSGYKSKDFCEQSCQLDYIYNTRGYISRFRLVPSSDTRKPFSQDADEEYFVVEECSRKCGRQECVSKAVKGYPAESDVESDHNVHVKIGYTKTTTQFFPKQTFEEFIVFLLGILGMWLGNSLFDVILYCLQSVLSLKRRYWHVAPQRRHNNNIITRKPVLRQNTWM